MADTKKGTATTTDNAQAAEMYTVEEFAAAAAKVFGTGVQAYTVKAAFANAQKDKATVAEAKTIVENFRKKPITK